MVKIATPISHLFENKKYAKEIMEHSDCLECRDESLSSPLLNQEVFHCELQPIHKLTKLNFKYLELLKQNKRDLKLLTFHVASSCDRPYLKNGIFEKGGKEYTEKEALKNAKMNFRKIRSIFNKNIKIAIENANYYPTNAYKYVTDASFISRIVNENNIDFVFDIAHARITAHNKEIDYEEYKYSLPIDKAIQTHISSFKVLQNHLAYDAHEYPKTRELAEVKGLLKNVGVRYLTVEYYKNIRYLMHSLKLLRELI